MHNGGLIRRVKFAARDKYAWPGGYPLMVLMHDGESICPDCAKHNFQLIARNTRDGGPDRDWQASDIYIHYEGPPERCAHCGEETPSAYGDPHEQDN